MRKSFFKNLNFLLQCLNNFGDTSWAVDLLEMTSRCLMHVYYVIFQIRRKSRTV